jgi:hypothetical protein
MSAEDLPAIEPKYIQKKQQESICTLYYHTKNKNFPFKLLIGGSRESPRERQTFPPNRKNVVFFLVKREIYNFLLAREAKAICSLSSRKEFSPVLDSRNKYVRNMNQR